MIQVQVDGNPLSTDIGGMSSLGDLLELVKSNIDPDTIITSVEFNGEALTESEWNLPLAAHRGRVLDIRTGTKKGYLFDRLASATDIVARIIAEFADAGDAYRKGFSPDGNAKLARAVDDLGAFVTWYDSLLGMSETDTSETRQEFLDLVNSLQKICEQIIQQQLFNSWWVLSETINTKLNPSLEEIRKLCERVASSAQD